MHSLLSTGISFAILFSIVGLSFAYSAANPPLTPQESYIGINGGDVTPAIAERLALKEAKGFLITEVIDGSPAGKAGLKGGDRVETVDGRRILLGGDIIVAIDGKSITGAGDLQIILQQKGAGDTVTFSVIRGANTLKFTIILEAKP